MEILLEQSRRKPNLKNHIDERSKAAVAIYTREFRARGQAYAGNEPEEEMCVCGKPAAVPGEGVILTFYSIMLIRPSACS